MIKCRTKQWGNSLGIIIPKEVVHQFHLRPNEGLLVEIKGKSHTILQELFGTLHFKKSTRQLLREARASLESKR